VYNENIRRSEMTRKEMIEALESENFGSVIAVIALDDNSKVYRCTVEEQLEDLRDMDDESYGEGCDYAIVAEAVQHNGISKLEMSRPWGCIRMDRNVAECYDLNDDLLGTISLNSEDCDKLIAGADPIEDGWEDGCGSSCSLDGWGQEESR